MFYAIFLRQSSFGIRDRRTYNVDFRIDLIEGTWIAVYVNGFEEKKQIRDASLSKEWLAQKSVKFITALGR